jgi:hypothetical protein
MLSIRIFNTKIASYIKNYNLQFCNLFVTIKMLKKILKDLIVFFQDKDKTANETFLAGNRKITFKDGLFHSLLKVIQNTGIIPATNIITFDIRKKFTPQAIDQSFQKVPESLIAQINKEILSKFFINQKRRILLVDGTKISLSRRIAKLENESFPLTNKKTYRKGLLTVIYDLEQKVPICYDLATHGNERESFLHLKTGDILIFDRGYYSRSLIKKLVEDGYNVIFRISRAVKNVFSGKLDLPFQNRTIKYIFKDTEYTLLTTLPDCFTTSRLSDLYHSRWQIEEFYKFFKLSLGADFYNLKKIRSLKQTLETQFLVALFISLIHKLDKTPKPKGLKPSPKYTLDFLKDFVYNILYDPKKALKFLKELLNHIWECCLTKIVNGRSFPRRAIVRRDKWYQAGEKS